MKIVIPKQTKKAMKSTLGNSLQRTDKGKYKKGINYYKLKIECILYKGITDEVKRSSIIKRNKEI